MADSESRVLREGATACALCGGPCRFTTDERSITFYCTSCETFRVSVDALRRVAEVSPAHRRALMLDIWMEGLKGNMLEIALADRAGSRIFQRRLVKKNFIDSAWRRGR